MNLRRNKQEKKTNSRKEGGKKERNRAINIVNSDEDRLFRSGNVVAVVLLHPWNGNVSEQRRRRPRQRLKNTTRANTGTVIV